MTIIELQLMDLLSICSHSYCSLVIVGAYETRPGIMYIEYLENNTVKDASSTPKTTSPAGKTEFPFDNLDQLLEEEQSLPPIPDFPSIWSTANTSNDELPKK